MKKVLYTDFVTTETLVEELFGNNKEIKKAITRSNLYKFWSKVAGEKFAPYLKSLKMNVKDLRFDPKKWVVETV